ncbi:hypothetical protein M0812_18274 [Anaeramoeba flamelloides]|uniref:Uncharacterized protein n=1 Tax=Anaeramoeba flamelloides TaxID=1746091 RepID=A0AAV7Z7B7_9EUKA|nr:hypothetical protein M0812_18274 [Anaeramoeba flamelloides]
MNYFLCLLFLFCSVLAATEPKKPVYPSVYHIEFEFSLPYAKLVEQYVVDYDAENNKERIDIYNGLFTSYYRYDKPNQDLYEVIVTQNNQTCFKNMGPHSSNIDLGDSNLTPILPDLTDWTFKDQVVQNGWKCNLWEYNPTAYNRTSYYKFYAKIDTDEPIKLELVGVDYVFGSHYDQYVFDFFKYVPKKVDSSIFEIPTVCNNPHDSHHHVFGRQTEKLHHLIPEPHHVSKSRFDKFTSLFTKNYGSEQERKERQQIFNDNYKKIQLHNHQHTDYKMKINHFADLTFNEFKQYYTLPEKTLPTEQEKIDLKIEEWKPNKFKNYELPDSFDWRDYGAVSNIKDQAVCGSCWAFSVIGALEGQLSLSKGKLTELSEQNVIDCTWDAKVPSYGCDGSDQWKGYEALMELGGVMSEEDYPYLAVTGYCGFDTSKKQLSIESYKFIPKTEEDVMQALYELGPLSVSYDVAESNVYYGGGYYYEPKCSTTDLDHAVLMIGWGNYNNDPSKPYWLIKNSWSTHWGDEGYMYISRKDNNCGFCTDATSPVLSRD